MFSIDYRLSPKNAYPDPINDVYQAYVWIITQAKSQLGLDIDNVIIAGDSAGGHMAITVSFLAALRGFRIPDAVFAHYPVLSIDMERFFPSLMLACDEELLSQPFMQFCLMCFTRNGGSPDKNPILSPIYAPDTLLKMLPTVSIMPCENDSLRDQSVYFAHRLLTLGVPTSIYYLKDFVHGFLNMDIKISGVDEFHRGVELTISVFRSMFIQLDLKKQPPPQVDIEDFQVIDS